MERAERLSARRWARIALGAVLLGACLAGSAAPLNAQAMKIAAIVNDQPISAWDIDQRFKFYRATGSKGSEGALRERSLKELVDEILMRQEAQRLGISIEEAQVRSAIDARLKPVKSNYPEFSKYLRSRGVYIDTLEDRMRSQLAWRVVIQRTYSNLVTISESDIEEAVAGLDVQEAAAEETWALKRIVLKVPKGAGDAAISARLTEAEEIRLSITDCDRAERVVKRIREAEITDLPNAKADDLVEPTRSLVRQASEGQVTPPNPSADGVEMIAVCAKRTDGGRRQVAERQLVNQEFEMLAERHLRDARQDAVIVYR